MSLHLEGDFVVTLSSLELANNMVMTHGSWLLFHCA